jgi:hypothetical protein
MKYFKLIVVLCAVIAFTEAAPRVKRSGDLSALLKPKMDLIAQLQASFANIAQSIQAQIQQKIQAKMAMKQQLMGSLTSGLGGLGGASSHAVAAAPAPAPALALPSIDIQGLIQQKINKKKMLLAPLTSILSPAPAAASASASAVASADTLALPVEPLEPAPAIIEEPEPVFVGSAAEASASSGY